MQLNHIVSVVTIEIEHGQPGNLSACGIELVDDAKAVCAGRCLQNADILRVAVHYGQIDHAITAEIRSGDFAWAASDGGLGRRYEHAVAVAVGEYAIEVAEHDREIVPTIAVEVDDLER